MVGHLQRTGTVDIHRTDSEHLLVACARVIANKSHVFSSCHCKASAADDRCTAIVGQGQITTLTRQTDGGAAEHGAHVRCIARNLHIVGDSSKDVAIYDGTLCVRDHYFTGTFKRASTAAGKESICGCTADGHIIGVNKLKGPT